MNCALCSDTIMCVCMYVYMYDFLMGYVLWLGPLTRKAEGFIRDEWDCELGFLPKDSGRSISKAGKALCLLC